MERTLTYQRGYLQYGIKKHTRSTCKKPDARYLSISQNDSDNERVGCECDECMTVYNKYGCWSGLYLEFVNRIAREIKDEYPNLMIHTFAYRFTRPVPEGLIPEDNVMIELCPIEANRRFPIEDYDKYTSEENYAKTDDFEILLKEWGNVCEFISIWDYVTEFSGYSYPQPVLESIKANIKLYADNNVKRIRMQGNYQSNGGEFHELKGYIMAKIMWDPYMSDEEYWALIDEFLLDVYGPGGTKLREYIDYMHEVTAEDGLFGKDIIKTLDSRVLGYRPNAFDSVPENLTADMIRNYETVDWLQYHHYYRDLIEEENPCELILLINEGKRLFAEAMEMAENDRQREEIDKAYIQVELLEAFYLHEKTITGISFPKDLVRNFCKANPDVFTKDEQKQYSEAINEFALNQIETFCYEYNKALSEKFDKYKIYNFSEFCKKAPGEILNFVTISEESVWSN